MSEDPTPVGEVEKMVANDAYDKHLEAGKAMDSLLHVDWEKQPKYGQELIETAIEGFEDAIEELETIRDGESNG